MELLRAVLRLEITIFIVALAAIVFFRLLTGEIDMQGLLYEKGPGKTLVTYSPARVQLLMLTLAAAAYYFSLVVGNLHAGLYEFPVLPEKWLLILGGSHAVFLGPKAYSLFGLSRQSNGNHN